MIEILLKLILFGYTLFLAIVNHPNYYLYLIPTGILFWIVCDIENDIENRKKNNGKLEIC